MKHYTPHHARIRDLLLSLGIIHHKGRQQYLFGTIAPELSTEEFIMQLVEAGFGNDFIAWKDDDEIASLRYAESFTHQYHLRIFADREVRGHYEYTPEYRPIAHIKGVGFEDRHDFFMQFLEGKIVLP